MINLVATASMLLSAIATDSNPVRWEADYGKALAATRSNDRPLLVVLDIPADTDSSFSSEQLNTKGKQAKLLSSYQLCHVDASTKYGQKVAEVFKAEKLPFAAVIDKTGSIVLCKKVGQLSSDEWKNILTTFEKGERSTAITHTTGYREKKTSDKNSSTRMFDNENPSTTIVSPSYCPSCQLKAQKKM